MRRATLARPVAKILLFAVVAVAVTATSVTPAAADDDPLTAPGETQQTGGESSTAEAPDLPALTSVEPVTSVGTGTRAVTSNLADLSVAVDMADLVGKERTLNADGTTTVAEAARGVDLTIQTKDAGFAVSAQLASVASLHQLRFDVSLPDGVTLELVDDGSIDVVDADGFTIGMFAAPWARAADGTAVETSYAVEGRTIVQSVAVVDEALYPVVADPEFSWGRISGTIYFNLSETGWICGSGIYALNSMMTYAPLWAYSVVANVIATIVFIVVSTACAARASDRCLKLKSLPPFVGSHGGNRCT